MPLNKDFKYYLEDVHFRMNVTPTMYTRIKRIAEETTMTQSAFEGWVMLMEDCALTKQLELLKCMDDR